MKKTKKKQKKNKKKNKKRPSVEGINLVSFMVKHLPLRAEEVGSILTLDRGVTEIPD